MSDFADSIYTLLQLVPKGKVTTYKLIAEALHTHAYQAVGQVLRRNPNAPAVPCHRVVTSRGTIGGFMGKRKGRAIQDKIRLLTSEGVMIHDGTVVDFQKRLFQFPSLPKSKCDAADK